MEFLEDYDRVDQLINDKPHMIKQVMLHIRKYVSTDHQTSRPSIKRAIHSSNKSCSKQRRSSSNNSSQIERTNSYCKEPSIHETSEQSIMKNPNRDSEIFQLENQYEQFNSQIVHINQEEFVDDHLLHQLETNVENLLQQIRKIHSKKCTFLDQLFAKYTIPYILSLTENDLNQRLEQLEKESHLLRLIKQVRFIFIQSHHLKHISHLESTMTGGIFCHTVLLLSVIFIHVKFCF